MKKIAVLAALMVALCFASEAKAFGPVRHAAGVRARGHVIVTGRGPILHDRGIVVRDRAFGYGAGFIPGRAPVLLRDVGGCGTVPAGLYGAAGLNSCAPLGVTPGLSVRIRVN